MSDARVQAGASSSTAVRRGDRFRVERGGLDSSHSSYRSPTHRDRDRILYANAFRRLEGVTQVASPDPMLDVHNRLTHSLRVEQLGVALCSYLNCKYPGLELDTFAVQAGCLAHDLGHPPFGHVGEEKLNALVTCDAHRTEPQPPQERGTEPCAECVLPDGFEGNAQSFRILTLLEMHRGGNGLGLDLTQASLRAASKYPWLRGQNPANTAKWGAYDVDASALEFAMGKSIMPSLEAQVMDWADDITYAIHDVEDYYRAGLIPLDQYVDDTKLRKRFYEYVEETGRAKLHGDYLGAATQQFVLLPGEPFGGSTRDYSDLDRFRSSFISTFIGNTEMLDEDPAKIHQSKLNINPYLQNFNALLKQMVWFHIIHRQDLAVVQHGQQLILERIYEALRHQLGQRPDPEGLELWRIASRIKKSGEDRLPAEVRRLPSRLVGLLQLGGLQLRQQEPGEYKDEGDLPRSVMYRALIDYIAGLTDARAYQVDALLQGREQHALDTVRLRNA